MNLPNLRNVEELSTLNWLFDRHSMHDLAHDLRKRRLGSFVRLRTTGEVRTQTRHLNKVCMYKHFLPHLSGQTAHGSYVTR